MIIAEALFPIVQSGNFLVCFKFVINLYSPSQTKIDKVEVRNSAKQLTKKARNVAKSGYYEIRLNWCVDYGRWQLYFYKI